jgi:Kef-type K+ transport system membrane component KefB
MEIEKLQLEVWEKVIDVQMHFNDLCLRIRSFAISILGVFLGSAAIAYRYAGDVEFFGHKFHTSAIFIAISIVVWFSFYLMDRFWYHELLKGAVHHGILLEESLKDKIPKIGLAHSIREQSHLSLKMNAAKKLNLFYGLIFLVQLIALIIIFTSGITKVAS